MTTETQLPVILGHFGIYGKVISSSTGPFATEINFCLTEGSKFATVQKLIRDIGRELSISNLKVFEVPDSNYICFSCPNPQIQSINFSSLAYCSEFLRCNYALPIIIGVNNHNETVIRDLSKMPHLLVAGTTGSGKSVGLNCFIMSLIAKKTPEELQFVLIDPKRVEFSIYNNQKYMMRPVITDMNLACNSLIILANEMENRYAVFEQNMVRNIAEYQALGKKMPYIVCVIDEFADLIMFDKTIEKQVQILAQKSRATGIHLIIATQRPSTDIITGTIKANLPTRLSYKVASSTDSMTILNTTGAEDLCGRGDSLLLEENGTLTHSLCPYVSNDYIFPVLQAYKNNIGSSSANTLINQSIKQKQEEKLKEIELQKEADRKTAEEYARAHPNFLMRIINFWNSIGKRNQNKIINFIVDFAGTLLGIKKSGKRK